MKWNSLTIIFHVVNGCEDHLRFFFAWRLFFKKWLLSDRGHFAVNNDALWPISGVVYRGRKYFTPWIVTLWSISVDRPNNSLFFFFWSGGEWLSLFLFRIRRSTTREHRKRVSRHFKYSFFSSRFSKPPLFHPLVYDSSHNF